MNTHSSANDPLKIPPEIAQASMMTSLTVNVEKRRKIKLFHKIFNFIGTVLKITIQSISLFFP
jgi:hypothetical protein